MIAVLLVTHGRMGQQLVDTVTGMLGELSLATDMIEVHSDADPDQLVEQARSAIESLDSGDGVLLLTDAFGSTPSNIANNAVGVGKHRVVAGINLPMLVRVYNYPDLSLDEMVASAVEAGRQGILPCARNDL